MLIRVDPQSPKPLFEQIAFAVKDGVARGELVAGEKLPSVRELAQELGINPNTVVRAYEALTAEGVVVRRQGAGVFVMGRVRTLEVGEGKRRLEALCQNAVTEAFHLGFGADEVRAAVEEALDGVQFRDGDMGKAKGRRR